MSKRSVLQGTASGICRSLGFVPKYRLSPEPADNDIQYVNNRGEESVTCF